MLCLRQDQPDPAQVADTALETLREEYSELEADPAVDPDTLCSSSTVRASEDGVWSAPGSVATRPAPPLG